MLRLAMCGWVNRQHGPSGARRCGRRGVRKIKRREKHMAPVTGRPSSSVAHGSAHTPPGAAATRSTVSESAIPVEQCPAGAVNQLQTLPVASGGTINGPSSGRTSRRSACSYTAAGIASSSRMLPCAKNRTLSSQSNAPSKEFTVQRQKKPQCPPAVVRVPC
ncbi:regulator of sigma E protease [Trypanosoma cruzi]|nr:regulator of sigma E protease [Trypanosoma cruzi]